MSKYIEVEKAKAIIFNCDMSMNDYEVALTKIDKNCEDVEPVRHGKWIENDTVTYRLYELNNGESYCQEIIYPFFCSECRGGSEYKSRYCMDCGAKMDKE